MVENPSKNCKSNISENTEENMTKKRKIIMEEKSKNKYSNGSRMVKLYCPVVSKIASIMAWEDQRLDLGTIARIFGIEPATLKLNGHYISRGVDLIASSVTWNSLISFFSSEGLSTGIDSFAALIVDGNVSRSGTKRTHEPPEFDRGLNCTPIKQSEEGVGICRYSHQEDINSPDSKKFKESNNALGRDSQTARLCGSGLKRTHCVEDISPSKRTRVSGNYSDENSLGA